MSERDVDCIYAIFSDPEVMQYWTIAPLRDRSDALRVLAESRVFFRRRESIDWGIVRQDNDILIGTVTLFAIDLNHLRAEIGFALARAYWRNGYMSEALHAAIAYAFDELHLRRIEADVDPRNLASVQLLRRLGFQDEGHLLERWLVNGIAQDSLLFGLLKSRWNGGGCVYQVIQSIPPPRRMTDRLHNALFRSAAMLTHIASYLRTRRPASLTLSEDGHVKKDSRRRR